MRGRSRTPASLLFLYEFKRKESTEARKEHYDHTYHNTSRNQGSTAKRCSDVDTFAFVTIVVYRLPILTRHRNGENQSVFPPSEVPSRMAIKLYGRSSIERVPAIAFLPSVQSKPS
jgi:hypothetical protein